jgi:phosphoethanolamine N-methyltransferase
MSRGDEGLKAEAAGKPTLKSKFKAWWEGYDLDAGEPESAPEKEQQQQTKDDGPPTVKGWSVSRQRSVVKLFGDGMTRCIPDTTKSKMIRPLGLDKTMSVSELGGNLGGFARWVAGRHKSYVTIYEEDEELNTASKKLTKEDDLHKKIQTIHCDLNDFQPKERSANVVYSAEALFHVKDKQKCFEAIHSMLLPEGQFMMSDFMLEGMGGDAPELDDWKAEEPLKPYLMDVQATRKLLADVGFEVSIAEDFTDEYRTNVQRAFSDYATRTANGEKSGHLHEWILKEGELWMRRVKMMEAGHLKVFQIYARVPKEIW